jgi:hypothetical protein
MSLDQLQPAEPALVGIYGPYCQGAKRSFLPQAISLYQKGALEGVRKIEGGDSIPFIATWYVTKLPAELTRCRLQFDGNADFSYEITLENSKFINYLIDVITTFKTSKYIDFSQEFYRKLLHMDD